MQIYTDFLRNHDLTVAQILLTRSDFGKRSSYLNIRNTLLKLTKLGIIPIINENDVVSTDELELNFGDNDWLAAYVAILVGADKLFYLTSETGLIKKKTFSITNKKEIIKTVVKVDEKILNNCLPLKSSSGTGGMESKTRAAGLAMSLGINTFILNGKDPKNVLSILSGKKIGTHFVANGKKIQSYRKWLATGALSKGEITIDSGAEKALIFEKKSLLAQGIVKVKGTFDAKDLIEIQNSSGSRLGIGRSRLSAKELKRLILSCKTFSLNPKEKPIVHRDHLFIE